MSNPSLRLIDVISDNFNNNQRYKLGKVLTIIDGCISDQEQRKAIKDLITQAFWDDYSYYERQDIIKQFITKFAPNMIPTNSKDLKFWNGYDTHPLRSSQNYFPDQS